MEGHQSKEANMKQATPNPEMQLVLDKLAELGPKPIESLSAEEARKQPTPADAVKALLSQQGKSAPVSTVRTEERMIPGPAGQIPIRVYSPGQPSGKLPVVVYYHGGGWVIADMDVYDSSPRSLAEAAKCVVVSVEYRHAPENKFPAAHEDAFAAYRWVVENAASVGGDPSRIAVAGESAGGNLAAAVAMMARDNGLPAPVHEVLVYPIANTDFNSPSYQENEKAKPLNKAMMKWFTDKYFSSPEDGKESIIALAEADLAGMPSATVITAEIDPLRSEGEQLATQLKDAGVAVRYRNYDGVTHEFFGMGAVLPEAKDAMQFAAAGLTESFASGS